jgi:cell division septum initiation protein DivIVA
MFGLPLGIVIETLVTILLATTIGYCVILNQRLKRLHADRGELKQMVADLVQATGLANAAIQELKHTAQEAETVLETRLGEAERFGVELAQHVSAGQQIMDRLARITSAARGTQPFDNRLDEPNKVQSALQQLSMRPRIRGNAA